MADARAVGGIELGGTKVVVAVGGADGSMVARATIPTREPELVLPAIAAFFETCGHDLAALGVGAFGPIAINPNAPDYGRLLQTNKPGWSGFDLVHELASRLDLPIALQTDVAAAAIGEAHRGALRGAPLGIYLTVGTGIGGAIVCNGQVLPALLHPEMGHLPVQRLAGDSAPSTCRFHSSCAEGLAAGPAIEARFGQSLNLFDQESQAHHLIADYLGQLCASLVLTLSPHRIVIGGGVSQTSGLLAEIGTAMRRQFGGYAANSLDPVDFLCLPALGQDAGIVGTLICAGQLGKP